MPPPGYTLAAVSDFSWLAALVFALDWALRLGTAVRIVMRRQPVEVALSWLALVMLLPIVGVIAYWTLSEVRIGRKQARKFFAVHAAYERFIGTLRGHPETGRADETLDARFTHLARQAEQVAGIPALPGNALELIPHTTDALNDIAAAIGRAKRRVDMVYYIFLDGRASQPVLDALADAAQRGVTCRVLVDAIGSRPFLKSPHADALRTAGVDLRAALPARLWRVLIQRIDLRNHRKLTVIDGEVAYTGSMNLVGPRRLKRATNVGPWIDAVVKVTGPAVAPLYAMFLEDWEAETGDTTDDLDDVTADAMPRRDGPAWVQVVPSGPHVQGQSIRELVISTIYAAREKITLTTPYFAPDDALLTSLTSAAARGVKVTLILPDRGDSVIAYHAGNAHLAQLMEAGVQVARFRGGVLHTKSLTVDEDATLIGTVNFDMRSFYLNFELSLLVYDAAFARQMIALQQAYLDRSTLIDLEGWAARPWSQRLLENTLRLAGPIV